LAGPYQRICRGCYERSGTPLEFPFDRDNFTSDGLLNLALAVWKKNALVLSFATIAMLLVGYLPHALLEYWIHGEWPSPRRPPPDFLSLTTGAMALRGGEQLIVMLLNAAAYLMYAGYLLDLLQSKPTGFAEASQRLRAIGSYFLVYLAWGATAALLFLGLNQFGSVSAWRVPGVAWLIVLLVAVPLAVYAFLGVACVGFEFAFDPDKGAWPAVRSSWLLVAGKRWRLLNVFILSTFIMFLGALACLVGMLAAFPIGMLFFAGLFLALKRPART
jgi:hypothetical protein